MHPERPERDRNPATFAEPGIGCLALVVLTMVGSVLGGIIGWIIGYVGDSDGLLGGAHIFAGVILGGALSLSLGLLTGAVMAIRRRRNPKT